MDVLRRQSVTSFRFGKAVKAAFSFGQKIEVGLVQDHLII